MGDTLCYDPLTGQIFYISKEDLEKMQDAIESLGSEIESIKDPLNEIID